MTWPQVDRGRFLGARGQDLDHISYSVYKENMSPFQLQPDFFKAHQQTPFARAPTPTESRPSRDGGLRIDCNGL